MASTSLELKQNKNQFYAGKLPFLMGDNWIMLSDADHELIEKKEKLLEYINSNNFDDSSVLIIGDSGLYFAILCSHKGAGNISLLVKDDFEKDNAIKFIDNNNLYINVVENIYNYEAFDFVIEIEEIIDNHKLIEDTIYCNLKENFEIKFPSDEIKSEFNESKSLISLLDIFIIISEKNYQYCFLRNWQLLTEGNDEFGDNTIDIYMSEKAKRYLESKVGFLDLENNNDWLLLNYKLDGDKIKLKIINQEINKIDDNILDISIDNKVIDSGIFTSNFSGYLVYFIYYSYAIRGGVDNLLTDFIEELILEEYSGMYEWRLNNYADIVKFMTSKNFDIKALPLINNIPNYLFDKEYLVHNYLNNNYLFRVYYKDSIEYRQAHPKIASRDIFMLENNNIDTNILNENDKYIFYSIENNKHQIIKNINSYVEILLSEEWKEYDFIKNDIIFYHTYNEVVILGMHRSGTSMLTSIIEELGVHIGTHILGKNDSNPLGHFEDQSFIDLNDKILNHFGGSWDNPPDQNDFKAIPDNIKLEIEELVTNKKQNIFWGWKDPRTSITFDLYNNYLDNPKIIIFMRDKQDVLKSLMRRNLFNKDKAEYIYNCYINNLDRIKKDNSHIELHYNEFINNFDQEFDKLAEYLELNIDNNKKLELKKLVKPKVKPKDVNSKTGEILNDINNKMSSGKFNEALELLNNLILNTNNPGSFINIEYLRAFCLFHLGKYRDAFSAAQNETIVNPQNEKAFELLEKISEKMPDLNQSIELPIEFSIIIPVYNNSNLTEICLDSIYKYTKDHNYEVIVVNNASTDNTADILENFKNKFNNYQIINNSENLGFAKANNQGIEARNGRHVMLLNNDTELTRDWAKPLLEDIKKGIGISGSLLLYPGTEFIQHYFVKIGTQDGKTFAPYHVHQYHNKNDVEIFSQTVTAVTGAAMMINSELLLEIPGFDEAYKNGLEDIDLCFNARYRGYSIRNNIDSIIYHYESMSEDRHKYDKVNWQRLNQKWLGKINFDEDQVDTSLNVHRINTQKHINSEKINKSIENTQKQDIKDQLINEYENIDFSIIIPVHNNLEFTKNCIDNIYKTSALFAIEVIIINNASTDGTESYLNSLGDQVQVINNTKNRSFSEANNQGAKIARGKYLVFLNNDVDVAPGWLESLESTFKNNKDIGIQGAKLLYPNGLIQHCGIVWGPVAQDLNLHFHIYLTSQETAPQVNKSREYQMVTGALLSIRKVLFDDIGGFDENYHFGHEDLDICFETRKRNYKVWYNHRVVATHHESITKKSEGIEKFERFISQPNSFDAKNHKYFLSKWENEIKLDSIKYYLEDKMYGLLGDMDKFELFENELKSIFNILKDVEEAKYQEKAGKVSEILFGKAGVDFVKNPALLLNIQYDVLKEAVKYLNGDKIEESKPKLLITMFGWNESGGGTILPKNMAIDLAKDGYDVTVFYAGLEHPRIKDPYYFDRTEQNGVKLIGVFNRDIPFINLYKPELEIYDSKVVEYFENLLDELKPDFVHFQNFVGLSFGIAEATYKRGIYSSYIPYNYHLIDPQLYMIESDLEKWQNTNKYENSSLLKENPELVEKYKKRDEAALNLLNIWVSNIQAVSTRVKDILIEFGVNPDKVVVINQISQFTTIIKRKEKASPNKIVRFGFIGGIMPHKGVHNIIAASSLLKNKNCEIILYGFVNDSYQKVLEEIQTDIKIHFKGEYTSDNMQEISQNIDIAILPSLWEDCGPHVISECLAMGLPIIAPNIGGFSDYILNGINGLLYNYNDINSLAKLMEELIVDEEKINLLIDNAKLTYNYRDYLNIIKDFYKFKPEISQLTKYKTIFKSKLEATNRVTSNVDGMNRTQYDRNIQGGFSNKNAKGKLPNPLPSPLKLNLGCGNDVRKGFLNLDLFSDDPNVIYMDVRNLRFDDGSVDQILASDILEHFSHREISSILNEWSRVLKPDGSLIIRCPNLRLQVDAYVRGDWNAEIASYMIFGGQTNPGDYHCIGFDEKSIEKYLLNAGFIVDSIQNEDFPQTKGYINLNMTVNATKKSDNQEIEEFKNIKKKFEENKQEFEGKEEQTDSPKVDTGDVELNIVWEGSQFVTHSLALINRELCYNIIRAENSNLTIIPYEEETIDSNINDKFKLLRKYDVREKEQVDQDIADLPYVWVRHQWPPKEEPPIGAKWILMQPWEYTSLRKDFLGIFENAFEVWTPSNYSRNAYINSGIDPNKIQIIPNGIDPELYKPFGDKFKLKTKKKLKFLFIGGSIMRKGIDILLNVYFNIFKPTDDVCLVIKDMGTSSFYHGQNMSDKIKEYQQNINYPEIEYINEELSQEEMASLYRACDVFVSPYRGEGFCLPALEAMASGLPVIVTEGGATDDFVDESCGWLIPSKYEAIGNSLNDKETVGEVGWLIPEQEVLGFVMKDIMINPSKLFSLGINASYRARKQWTWRNSTLKMFSRLDAISGTSMSQKALKNIPEYNDLWIELGYAEELFNEGSVDESAKIFLKISQADMPEEIKLYALNVLTLIDLENGDLEHSKIFIERAREINSNNIDSYYLESKLNALEDNLEKALEIINPIVENWKENKWNSKMGLTLDDLITYMGDVIFDMGDPASAIEIYESALEHNPANLNAKFGAGMCFKINNEIEKAIEMFEEAIKIDDTYELAIKQLEELR